MRPAAPPRRQPDLRAAHRAGSVQHQRHVEWFARGRWRGLRRGHRRQQVAHAAPGGPDEMTVDANVQSHGSSLCVMGGGAMGRIREARDRSGHGGRRSGKKVKLSLFKITGCDLERGSATTCPRVSLNAESPGSRPVGSTAASSRSDSLDRPPGAQGHEVSGRHLPRGDTPPRRRVLLKLRGVARQQFGVHIGQAVDLVALVVQNPPPAAGQIARGR